MSYTVAAYSRARGAVQYILHYLQLSEERHVQFSGLIYWSGRASIISTHQDTFSLLHLLVMCLIYLNWRR